MGRGEGPTWAVFMFNSLHACDSRVRQTERWVKAAGEELKGLPTSYPLSVFRFKKDGFLGETSHVENVEDFWGAWVA